MDWKPPNEPIRYDRARVERTDPIAREINKLGLPVIRQRKLNGILSALIMQIEDSGDSPEVNRMLVVVMNRQQDFEIARDQGWYRLPASKAGRGTFFEYVAFNFTAAFAEDKWAIHYYTRNLGHELASRGELLPEETDHPRAAEPYCKLQLAPLQRREPPIPSLRWRRIIFIYTTWDRFQAAEEINDLYAEGREFVDRLYHALRESGLTPERCYPVREGGVEYVVDLTLPCREGVLVMDVADTDPQAPQPDALRFTPEMVAAHADSCLADIKAEVDRRGGVRLKS